MLRPVSFSLPSSTELRVVFNRELSKDLSKENFLVESVSGNVDDLEVRRVEVFGSYVVVTTAPQVAGNFYTLYLKDSSEVKFSSLDGARLINDDVSRELFFVGLKKHNPVRDRMYSVVPKLYDLENTNISNIISAQAEEIFQAQKDLGKVLSNNYISVSVENERRIRSSGATDRLQNEGVYNISRVSKFAENDRLSFFELNYSESSEILRHDSIPNSPVSLQEVYAHEEEISTSSTDNSFEGFLLTLSNKNIIKVLSVNHIKPNDIEDCDGEIGKNYSITTCKYSLAENKYDPIFAFKNKNLETNQVLLSSFGNIDRPIIGDKIIVSYLYKDKSIRVNKPSIEVYNLTNVKSEVVPVNTTRFYLKNAPIVNSSNEIMELGGVLFSSELSDGFALEAFSKELPFNSSKLPSKPGEYAINYSTGEVIVFGYNETGQGTGSGSVMASYTYRNVFKENLDYHLDEEDLVASPDRPLAGSSVNIGFNFNRVLVEGEHYLAPCHTEVFNEHVANNLESSFVVRPTKTPVTDVYRIQNQTTGETYLPLYFTEDEIHFTGKRSPEIKTASNELARFSEIEEEEVDPSAEFISPAFDVKITSNASNSSIIFSPGIPSELIDVNSTDYFARSLGLLGDDEVSDLQIRFFGEPDSGGLISSFAISATATAPSLGESVYIGPRVFRFELKNEYILSRTKDSIGTHINSSVNLSKKDVFKREKYFDARAEISALEDSKESRLIKVIPESDSQPFTKNMSRIRRVGDYSIDYNRGVIYVAVGHAASYEPMRVSYSYGAINTLNKNIVSLTGAYKKIVSSETASNANITYDKLESTPDHGYIRDMDLSLQSYSDGVTSMDPYGSIKDCCVVLSDYTILTPNIISSLRGVYSQGSLEGSGLRAKKSESRLEDFSADEALVDVKSGGANLFDKSLMSFSDNLVDLKVRVKKRAQQIDGRLVIDIQDPYVGDLYNISHIKSGEELFDEKLNINKVANLDVVFSGAINETTSYADIRSGSDLSNIEEGDFLLDSAERRFEVLSVDQILSKIILKSPADNNIEAEKPALGLSNIIVKAEMLKYEGGLIINIPMGTVVESSDLIDITYIQNFVPKPGTKVSVDCSFGPIYIDYIYVYDDIYVSYEYGDNEIDWSVSSEVSEGEEYFVSYEYGASRRALKDNFGILTKIPFFQRFPLEADREVYRSGLQGVMNAFSSGAMKPSFERLVESFTDITPNIEESFFGNWILGRDSLTPEQITVDGPLSFRPGKFGDGIYVGDNTVVSTPALSNLNLDEGTFSAWVAPDWSGINNDAEITFDLDNIGIKEYSYRSGSNIFDYESGFSTFASQDAIGAVDLTGMSISLHNFTHVWSDNDEGEEVNIGAFALKRVEPTVDRTISTDMSVSLRVSSFSVPKDINPPRRKPSEDIATNRVSLGITGLGKSISDASRGLVGSGSELESIHFCSPAFISSADNHKIFMTMFNMVPVINNQSGRIYTFRVGHEHIDKNIIPKYDRGHITRSCHCSVDNTISELSRFRDKDFQTLKVELDFSIDLSYIDNLNVFLDKKASVFRLVDTTGSVYEVYALIGPGGEIFYDSVPNEVFGFYINRVPENKEYITAQGSEAINKTEPLGEITVLYQTISILTNNADSSSKYLGYEPKDYVLDWMSDHVDFSMERRPLDNLATLSISRAGSESKIKVFYSDLIGADQEKDLLSHLNLDKWFNTARGINSIDSSTGLSKGFFAGSLDRTTMSEMDIDSLSYRVYNKYSLDDIYIGSSAENPKKIPFSVSKDGSKIRSIGIPHNSKVAEGLFVGYDDTCSSPMSETPGQWVFRARTSGFASVPVGVVGSDDGFRFTYENIPVKNIFSGKITTDGEFSSVFRSKQSEDGVGCPTQIDCSADYRYCGCGTLEEDGWVKLEESNSSLINTLIGGYEGQRSTWAKHGAFATSESGGVYRMGQSVAAVDNEAHSIDDGNFLYTRLPCYDGDYTATVGFRVPSVDYRVGASSGLNSFSGMISGVFTGISPLHIYDEDINIKLSLAKSDHGQPLVLVINGDTDEVIDISYFAWDSEKDCYLTISKEKQAGAITVSSNGSIISRLWKEEVFGEKPLSCSILNEPFLAIHLFDSSAGEPNTFHQKHDGNIVDITLIEYSGKSIDSNSHLEDDDILISTDSKIQFSFKTDIEAPVQNSELNLIPDSDNLDTSICHDEEILTELVEESGRKAKLFGAYKWVAFDGTVPAGKYREDQNATVKLLRDMGCNLYVRGCHEGVSPHIEAIGDEYYYGSRTSSSASDPTLEAGNFSVVYSSSAGYEELSAWDEFINLLEKTKGTGIKVLGSTGEKHHLRGTKDNGDGTYVIYPDRWGMHRYSTPEESTQSLILRMRELATMTLPISEGGMGYDHLIGLLHDDTSNSIGQGLWNPGDYEHGYTPEQILSITNAARDINPNFEFIPTMYYQRFGALMAKDGIELGQKTMIDGVQQSLRPGVTDYGTATGPEGASAYYTFDRPEGDGPVFLSFAYQSRFSPQETRENNPGLSDAEMAVYESWAENVHTECFLNDNLIFSENLNRNNIVSFFESEDLSSYLVDGENQIEIRLWNKSADVISGNLAKIAWFWDFELTHNETSITDSMSDPSFFIADKSFSQGHITEPKMYARSNSAKAVHSSLTSVSPVYPKNLTGVPGDHEKEHYIKVINMVKKHMPDALFIEQERAYAWGSPVDPDIFSMKIDEASKIADGVLVYNVVVETIRQEENEGVFADPNTELELRYSKVAWTPINYEPKNGYFREWTTTEELSGPVTFDLFADHLYPGGGKYDFFLYDDSDTLLYSGNNGVDDIATSKHDVGYGYGIGVADEFGVVQPVILNLAEPTKLRFLWKVKGTYGGLYNFLRFRIVLGEMSRDFFGRGQIYNEEAPTYVENEAGDQLEVYPRSGYSYNAGISPEAEEEYSYMKIINSMSDLYKNVLADQISFLTSFRAVCYDGYIDSYTYTDGYIYDEGYDVDELCFTSDKLRYLVDTGQAQHKNRLSIFKDGKGFLNFRVLDNDRRTGSGDVYNIATNIKHFKPGELHHIAASWRFNTLHEKDEMHLFVDGVEAPNLYRFGGPVKTRVNDKFSDVSKEVLQDFMTEGIEYGERFFDGTILAGTAGFRSKSARFTQEMVGRTILFHNSSIADSYIGGEYIISSVNGDEVTFVHGGGLDLVTFYASASDITFSLAPAAGIKEAISTDLKNSKFSIFREDCSGNLTEMGGVHYRVVGGEIVILSGDDIINPEYRVNVDNRVVEFVKRDHNCKYVASVEFSDLDVHIKTFGLKFSLFNEKVNLSSSSYFYLDNIKNDLNSGKSMILNHAAEPVSLEDVSITRIILDRVIPEVKIAYSGEDIKASFDLELDKSYGTHKISSEPGRVHKTNAGRFLTVNFDSDNTIFCKDDIVAVDGYIEDGYVDSDFNKKGQENYIKVIGETVDGSGYEVFEVKRNGNISGKKLFLSVDRVEGEVSIADPIYEPFVVQVFETDSVTKQNNDGEFAEVYRYVNGSLVITSVGSEGLVPFELHPGNYMIKYPAHLKVSLPEVGEDIFLGSDMFGGGQFGGVIDEAKIITEMSSDTRPTQRFTLGTRSITEDFFSPNPACSDDQTLLLAHFNNPIREQSRRLRQKEFLNEESNFKYKLDREDREDLLSVVNDRDEFEAKMMRKGFDKATASQVFTEVHHAQGGPVFNEARFGRSDNMRVSSTSVNSSFGMSARFFDTPPLIVDNKLSYFRKDAGTIEMWVSPLLDTIGDNSERYFFDVYSILKKRVRSSTPNTIELPSPAKKILKVELVQSGSEFSDFAVSSDATAPFLDEVYRNKVTGRLTGGTGVGKDFSTGSRLSPDGKSITLQSALPGSNIDVVVSYIPTGLSGDRISIYKNKNSQIVFSIKSEGSVASVVKDVDWKRNSWHKITCTYKANSSEDFIKMFVDGVDCSSAAYGDQGLTYGGGLLYGQQAEEEAFIKKRIVLRDDFRVIAIGADAFGDRSALSRVDNIRLSRIARDMPEGPGGSYIDISYSQNIETAVPSLADDVTTVLINFEEQSENTSYAKVVDPSSGIFDFDIEVLDYFSKIKDEVIEDLILQLVNRLKPAHTNAVVVFPRESC